MAGSGLRCLRVLKQLQGLNIYSQLRPVQYEAYRFQSNVALQQTIGSFLKFSPVLEQTQLTTLTENSPEAAERVEQLQNIFQQNASDISTTIAKDGSTELHYASAEMLHQYFSTPNLPKLDVVNSVFQKNQVPFHECQSKYLDMMGVSKGMYIRDARWRQSQNKCAGRGFGNSLSRGSRGKKRANPFNKSSAHKRIFPFYEHHKGLRCWNKKQRYIKAPFFKLVPKRVFHFETQEYRVLTLDDLKRAIEMGCIRYDKPITVKSLYLAGIVPKDVMDGVYVTQGVSDKFPWPINLVVNYVSQEAKSQIVAGGGVAVSACMTNKALKAKLDPEWFETEGRLQNPREYLPYQWTHTKYDIAVDPRAEIESLNVPSGDASWPEQSHNVQVNIDKTKTAVMDANLIAQGSQ